MALVKAQLEAFGFQEELRSTVAHGAMNETTAYQNEVYLLPTKLDEKMTISYILTQHRAIVIIRDEQFP